MQEEKGKKKKEFLNRLVQFTVAVIKLARKYASDKILFPIFIQVIRSAGSIGANIMEANGALSRAGYARYFRIALQSTNETGYWFQVLKGSGVNDMTLDSLEQENIEFIRILTSSLRTLSRPG